MNLGKATRLNRLFSHPSGKFFSVAIDHFIGYNITLPEELYDINDTIARIVTGKPDAITMQIGIAKKIWTNYAGQLPLILQSTLARPDDTAHEIIASAEDAVILGADAIAVVAFVRGNSEARYLKAVVDVVKDAEYYDLPVICHVYPRNFSGKEPSISFEPEDIAWAVHCALETGVDVIKTPFCGDVKAYAQIVNQTPVPVIAAGGPKQDTIQSAFELIADVMKSGAKGATIGRNVWGSKNIVDVINAFKSVIHDGESVEKVLGRASTLK